MLPVIKTTNAMRLDVNLVPSHATHNVTTGFLGLFNSRRFVTGSAAAAHVTGGCGLSRASPLFY